MPGKRVQLSLALAKLTEVGFLMETKKARGMMLAAVSRCRVLAGREMKAREDVVTRAIRSKTLLATHTVDRVLAWYC